MKAQLLKRRMGLFPISTRVWGINRNEQLRIAGVNLIELAREYGTPLYLYDRLSMDASVDSYNNAFNEFYPGKTGITYAGKAFLCLAIAQWVKEQGLWLDCTGAGELAIASKAGIRSDQLVVHGVNKSSEDLQAAVNNAGTIVVDNLTELERIIAFFEINPQLKMDLWLRLRPGTAVATHAYRQTGQEESKFGLNPVDFERAVKRCLGAGIKLKGMHFHLGSHFSELEPLGKAVQTGLELAASLRQRFGWLMEVFCPGGGWGVPYHEDELPYPEVKTYIQFLAERLIEGCRWLNLPLPRLQLEPGRSLVGRAGVAIYQTQTVKHSANRRWILLDGGMADNPRPALYKARYSALPVWMPGREATGPAWLAGPYCESGDILIENLPMPDLETEEFIAVPVAGAYQLSMGSNYNGARRPAVVWLEGGKATLIQRRESLDDLMQRDLPLLINQGSELQ